jgi:hypothetical protein
MSVTPGALCIPYGKARNDFSYRYKRPQTTTLFAALHVLTGQVKAGHHPLRRCREFLEFMDDLVAAHPGLQIHFGVKEESG